MSVEKSGFGAYTLYTIKNAAGASVSVTDLGAAVQSIIVPDRNGVLGDVVLGYDTPQEYLDNDGYFGATVGRYANRIAGAQFTLNGNVYKLTANEGANTLHGGVGFSKRRFDLTAVTENSVRFELTDPDGGDGFPGNITVSVEYEFTDDNRLVISYTARSDKDTVLNLTNHSYFIYIVEETVKCNNCNTTTDGMVIIFNQGEKVISLCKYCSANLQEILYCYLKGIEHISTITKSKIDVSVNKINDDQNELKILDYKIVMSDEDFLSFYRKVNAVNYFYYETYKTSFKKCSHLWKNITHYWLNKKYQNKNYSRDSVIPHEKALEINLIRMNKYLSKRNRIKYKNNLVVMPDLLNAAPVNRLKVNQHCSLYDLKCSLH